MMERDVRMSALKTEEAALLPAMPRQSLTGGAALRTALRTAAALADRQTGNAVAAAELGKSSPARIPRPSVPSRPVSRAALYQALRGGRR